MRKTALVPSAIGVAVLALGLTLAGCSSTPSASSPSADTICIPRKPDSRITVLPSSE